MRDNNKSDNCELLLMNDIFEYLQGSSEDCNIYKYQGKKYDSAGEYFGIPSVEDKDIPITLHCFDQVGKLSCQFLFFNQAAVVASVLSAMPKRLLTDTS